MVTIGWPAIGHSTPPSALDGQGRNVIDDRGPIHSATGAYVQELYRGTKVSVPDDRAQTPYPRLLAHADIDPDILDGNRQPADPARWHRSPAPCADNDTRC